MSLSAISRFPAIVDDVTVRLIAGVILGIGAIALVTQQWWVYAVLAADFLARSVVGPQVSPLARFVQRFVRPRVRVATRPTAGAPKQFAAAIGAVMTTAATVFLLVDTTVGSTGAYHVALGIGVVMVVFPALEAFLGLCVGCKVFAVLIRAGWVDESVCLDCAPASWRSEREVTTA